MLVLCFQGLCDPVVSAAGGSVRSVKVARHRGPNGKLLSAGFGFVECSSEQAARAALKRLQARPLFRQTVPLGNVRSNLSASLWLTLSQSRCSLQIWPGWCISKLSQDVKHLEMLACIGVQACASLMASAIASPHARFCISVKA